MPERKLEMDKGKNRMLNIIGVAALAIVLGILMLLDLGLFGGILVLVVAAIKLLARKHYAPGEPQEECELCGIKTDPEALIPALLPSRDPERITRVCGECFRANHFRRANEQAAPAEEKTAGDEPVQEEAEYKAPAGNKGPLISETVAEQQARLAALTGKRKSGEEIPEDYFLEDIEDVHSVKKIHELWKSYDFSREYTGIDASLENIKNSIYASAGRLKEELKTLLRG